LGRAEISSRYAQGERIILEDGSVVAVEDLKPGMVFRLEAEDTVRGTKTGPPETARVTKVEPPGP
jgi:hypothetical protein